MNVVQLNIAEREDEKTIVDSMLLLEKQIAKDLTKGYMKLLSNLK